MTKTGLLIVFSGPSGVGKGTVMSRFLAEHDDCVLSVSATTREPREGEVSGREYHFISRERFGELVARGDMLEYASYSDNLYGTPRSAVDEQLRRGKNVILEIDVKGAMDVKRQRPDAVFVFMLPPSRAELRRRLVTRGTESSEYMEKRLAIADREMLSAHQYDYVLINDDVEHCCETLSAILTAARCSVANMREFIQEVTSDA